MRKNVTLGIIIIFIGTIWLLSNLNIFSFSIINVFLRSLATLWPLILIGFGLSILLKENGVFRLLIWLIILVTILLYGVSKVNSGTLGYEHLPSDYNYSENHDYSISKEAGTEVSPT
jgi:fatty acid desaturase